ncbi:type II secretion system F family protein [Aliivibrio fischeri]|uniref:type II secretion system F family protein n=1 Tax=Aliivibrio fischeri TaxID=668 RepID=UPI00084C2931|nr:type II secretion system F family protein [Aliivibrio fischeri]OED58173.1 pilus assembly protein TadB [Aliivibrio fischeri]
MIYWFSLIIGGMAIILIIFGLNYSQSKNVNKIVSPKISAENNVQAVNLVSLSDVTSSEKFIRLIRNSYYQIDTLANIKVPLYFLFLIFISFYINNTFIHGSLILVLFIVEVLGFIFAVVWLKNREETRFEESFPEALNMLSGAVSSGESIIHAIIFVGNSLDGKVGGEFKRMGDQLQLGEPVDAVFRKSCSRFPYPSFQFFVITIRTSMQRGGQLKDVMTRLNRLMFGARAIEKKKMALTSEARASAKIVGAIPFIFLFMLQFLSPENYNYVMFNPDGRPILYYVVISESIGIFIIWLLMKGVK